MRRGQGGAAGEQILKIAALWAESLLLGRERRGLRVRACGELLVEHVEAHAVVADELELVDELAAVVLLLDLLRLRSWPDGSCVMSWRVLL